LAQFSYKAVDKYGGHTSGVIDAADRRSAVASLANNGQFALELLEQAHQTAGVVEKAASGLSGFLKVGSGRITGKDILAVTSQLSAALQAGLPLLNGLEIIRDQQHKKAMKNIFDELVKSVSSGQSLSDAMSKHKEIFSPLYLSMIRVGETGGMLEKTSAQLVKLLDRDEKIKTSMKNASAYPVFVLGVGLLSVIVIITSVLPKILNTISGGYAVLPLPTKMLMALSGFIKSYGWLAAVLIAVAFYYFRSWSRNKGRVQWDAFKLKIPILGFVLRTIAVGRFAKTLGALTKGGVTILEALGIVRDTLGNELLGREIDQVAEKVKAGSSLAGPLGESGNFPPLLIQIVSIGEQTGRLDELLLGAGVTFDEEADSAISKFIAVFPAVLILLLALIIGFIIAATLLPIVMMELGGAY